MVRKAGLFLVAVIFLNSCGMLAPENEEKPVQIQFVASGGIAGAVMYKLSITEDGMAIHELAKPQLQKQLSGEEFRQLLSLFDGFRDLKEIYDQTVCADDIRYEITLNQNGKSKKVTAYGCTLSNGQNDRMDLIRLKAIIGALINLSDQIYQEMAPWLGLQVAFALDDSTYGLGEPISLEARVYNPTEKTRTLYFATEDRIGFSVSGEGFSGFHYFFPEQREEKDLVPIALKPGEEKVFRHQWDQLVPDREGNRQLLQVGRYRIAINLLDTGRTGSYKVFAFDVVDRSIPLAGYIEPDYRGEDRSVSAYTFKLRMRNWTEQPVVLNFPYQQHLSIKLYDLDKPGLDPLPLLYEGPKDLIPLENSLTLQPGEQKLFQYIVEKSDLNLTYMWYYVQIRLLISNFVFERDGKVRIFK